MPTISEQVAELETTVARLKAELVAEREARNGAQEKAIIFGHECSRLRAELDSKAPQPIELQGFGTPTITLRPCHHDPRFFEVVVGTAEAETAVIEYPAHQRSRVTLRQQWS